jgi:hypothetical protein
MIRYSLRCSKDHEFEAWFRSSADYDRAAAAGEAACPLCGSVKVEKAIMAPAPLNSKHEGKMSLVVPDPKRAALKEAMIALRKQVTENADYVGDRFPEEARKIHYEEVEARGIYGEATPDEARDLADEGIGFMPLPRVPDDTN